MVLCFLMPKLSHYRIEHSNRILRFFHAGQTYCVAQLKCTPTSQILHQCSLVHPHYNSNSKYLTDGISTKMRAKHLRKWKLYPNEWFNYSIIMSFGGDICVQRGCGGWSSDFISLLVRHWHITVIRQFWTFPADECWPIGQGRRRLKCFKSSPNSRFDTNSFDRNA